MKTRDLGIDMIKIVAMFSVILLHCSVAFDTIDNDIVANVMKTWGLTAVPLFFMVSGFLMFGKSHISYSYVIKKIFLIFRFVACFSFLYWLVFAIRHMDFSIMPLITGCLYSYVNRGYFPWFWYFGSMSIIYVLLPLLYCIFPKYQKHRPKQNEIICQNRHLSNGLQLIGVYFLIIILLTIQFVVFQYAVNQHMSQMGIRITFKLYNWLTFFVVGGIIKIFNFKYKNWLMIIVLFLVNFFFQIYEKKYLPQTEFIYSSLPLLFLTVSIFLFIKSIDYDSIKRLISQLSKLFLLVYSIHLLIMRFIPSYLFGQNTFSPLLYFFVISILSVIISFMITRIPVLNKLLSI